MSQSTPDNPSPRIPFQTNPFASAALGSPWIEGVTDVAGINDAPFRTIAAALRQMQIGSKGTSIVVTGEPGSGKTHLLSRLRNSLDRDPDHPTIYVYVRCNASAATLWRHLREFLASDLLKPSILGPSRLDALLRQRSSGLENVAHLALRRALECLRDGRHFHIASAWLRGEPVADADLSSLGIAIDSEDEDRNREAKRTVDALLRFIAPTPTVLCFDQVEGLATYSGDETGFHALGQLISALVDGHDNLLLISCMVAAFEGMFDRLPNGADKDRWRQEQVNLRPIDWEQALQLVQARLDAAPVLASLRRAHANDPLWPLDQDALKPLFAATGLCLPRKLIQTCKQQFEQLLDQGIPRPVRSRNDFLQEEYAANLAEARLIVQRQGADKTLSECLPWLLQNSGLKQLGQSAERSGYVHVAFADAFGDTGLLFSTRGGNNLTNKLRRADSHWKMPNPLRLKILRDASVTPGKVAAELLGKLKSKGAAEIFVLPEAVAALQAIRNMTAAASAGDLSQDGNAITAHEVTAWALANLPAQLEKLRDDLAGKSAVDPTLSRLSALLTKHKIIEAEAAAHELGVTAEEVSACARCHPMEFGVLEGPPLVFFEAVEGQPAEAAYA
jgi:AAA ATPase domain